MEPHLAWPAGTYQKMIVQLRQVAYDGICKRPRNAVPVYGCIFIKSGHTKVHHWLEKRRAMRRGIRGGTFRVFQEEDGRNFFVLLPLASTLPFYENLLTSHKVILTNHNRLPEQCRVRFRNNGSSGAPSMSSKVPAEWTFLLDSFHSRWLVK